MKTDIKKSNKNKWLVALIVIVFVIYIAFSIYSSINTLSIENKTVIYNLGLCNNEKAIYGFFPPERDGSGRLFRWVKKESELLVKARGEEKMVISIFNPKPDIESDHITIEVFLNGDNIYEIIQGGNDMTDIQIDISDKGIEKGDFINLKFVSNKSWIPKDYGISDDKREISFALMEIKFN